MAVSCLLLGLFTPNLGILWISVCSFPDLSNRTKPNKKPLEPNRTPIVRLGSAIEQNRTPILLWVRFSNQSSLDASNWVKHVESNHWQLLLNNQELNIIRSVIERSIGFDYQSFGDRTFDCVRLAKFYCEFDYVRLSSAIERLVFDWVRLPNCSIG